MVRILGINAYHGDASAASIVDGRFTAGVEEERFTRVKHWAGFPAQAIEHCTAAAGGDGLGSIDAIAISRKPNAHLLRKVWLTLHRPRAVALAFDRVRNMAAVASIRERLATLFPGQRIPVVHRVEHHHAHIASAFFCSPYEDAACLSVDGFGDFVSTMMAVGRGERLEVLDQVLFPHSLGLFYTAITQYLGFPKYGDEYKVMGLAAYGEPSFTKELSQVVTAAADGLFRLDLKYFNHLAEGMSMSWDDGAPVLGRVFTPALEELLGSRRQPDDEIEQRHMDVAASLQSVYEQRFFSLVREVMRRTGSKRLALAGGCGMNSLANGRMLEHTDVQEVFVQAAAGDAGTALGAALFVHSAVLGQPRDFIMEHSFWGPEYDGKAIRKAIADLVPGSNGQDGRWADIVVRTVTEERDLVVETARAIANGEVVGWYQGRSEWGPRALGNRSILADPRRADMREILNLKIKRREPFRPFAPSILEEQTGDWFTIDYPDPFMIKVYPIREERRSMIPAVTHADGTGRLQTVSRATNPRYWSLIRAFEESTGVPLVLNTSFNENEPIVNTPREALECFVRTKMDRIVLGDVVITRGRAVDANALLAKATNDRVPGGGIR